MNQVNGQCFIYYLLHNVSEVPPLSIQHLIFIHAICLVCYCYICLTTFYCTSKSLEWFRVNSPSVLEVKGQKKENKTATHNLTIRIDQLAEHN